MKTAEQEVNEIINNINADKAKERECSELIEEINQKLSRLSSILPSGFDLHFCEGQVFDHFSIGSTKMTKIKSPPQI